MPKYKNLNTLFFFVLALLIVLTYFKPAGLLPYLILILIYLVFIVIGSFRIQMNFYFPSLNSGPHNKKQIALTFDDGPHPEVTPKVLDMLETHEVKATFFCIGKKAEQYPEIMKETFKRGHIIGNHSYTHSPFFDLYSPVKMTDELDKTTRLIEQTTGWKPLLFRPPYGVTNPMLKKALKKTKLISVGWSVRSLDTVKSPEKVLNRLKKKTHNGAVILLHDSQEKIIPVLAGFLPWLKEHGYQVTKLDELLNIKAYEHD